MVSDPAIPAGFFYSFNIIFPKAKVNTKIVFDDVTEQKNMNHHRKYLLKSDSNFLFIT